MNCLSKYKIDSWIYNGNIVYTPCYKESFFFFNYWVDLISEWSPPLNGSNRGFCFKENEAREIIAKHKQDLIDEENREINHEQAKKKFGKIRTICVD
jgi:hypothetical protein